MNDVQDQTNTSSDRTAATGSRTENGEWSAERLWGLLTRLGKLRIISSCGPSTFEAICEVPRYGNARGFLNVITDGYHWHLEHARFGHLRSCDGVNPRSGRRVLYFELRETPESEPFLWIYLYRAPDGDFEPEPLERFQTAHLELKSGRLLQAAPGA